ncbi:MAG: radical SAM protein [Desulfurococcaceae archaeon]
MDKPGYLIWIFTAICNLNCLHCYTYRFRGMKELGLSDKLKIAREIGELGVEYVNLTGGEPLIHPHLPFLLRELDEYGVEKSVVTNATIVSENVFNLLVKTNTYVFVTIEGPRDIHDEIRGRGAFDKVIENTKLIKSRVGHFSVVTTINKLNYMYTDKIVDLAIDLGADELAVLPVMPSGRALETKTYIEPFEYLLALLSISRKARSRGLPISAWCTPWAPLLKGLEGVGFWFCREMNGMDIDPAGNVLLCDILDFKITNVIEKGVLGAFREFKENQLVKSVSNPLKMPSECAKCDISLGCRGGCFARSYILKGDLNAGDPLCPVISKSL